VEVQGTPNSEGQQPEAASDVEADTAQVTVTMDNETKIWR